MNMFISILNDVLVEVHADVKLQDNDYEMVDYMVNSMRSKSINSINFCARVREVVGAVTLMNSILNQTNM